MKQIKLLGLSLLAIFALGVLAAASASAAEEGFLVGGSGTPATATVLGSTSTLETAKEKIQCALLDDSTIRFGNDKHATGTLHWLKCKAEGLFGANSLSANPEEILVPVLFLICLIVLNDKKELLSEFGVIAEVSKVHLEVPAVGVLVEVNGTVIGAFLTSGSVKLFVVDFVGAKGVQSGATLCKQDTTDFHHSLTSKTDGGTAVAASENVVTGLVQFGANTELMDK